MRISRQSYQHSGRHSKELAIPCCEQHKLLEDNHHSMHTCDSKPEAEAVTICARRSLSIPICPALLVILGILLVVFGSSCNLEAPANPGYLRVSDGKSSRLITFDADTFEVHRSVKFPPSYTPHSHRLEMDPQGRIWAGYIEPCPDWIGCWPWDQRRGVSIFSPRGGRLHSRELLCGAQGGLAFANGYAFIGCARVVEVVAVETLAVVKRIEWEAPPSDGHREGYWRMTAIEEIDGSILVIMRGPPPEGYGKLTNSASGVASVGVIDPETLTVKGYLTSLEPGSRISDAVEVDGKAWLFNELSHVVERPPRTDVYVMDPQSLEIVDSFNLENPFPKWARRHADGSVYIFHWVPGERLRRAGFESGITRLDPATRREEFIAVPDGLSADDIHVYRGRPCLAEAQGENRGLWCMNEDGELELQIPEKVAVGVLFGPPGP